MNQWIKRSRLPLWIALFAILLNALAPSISHALYARNGASDLFEICTVSGTQFVSIDSAKNGASVQIKSSKPATPQLLEHCPFCMTHAGSFALPSTPPVAPFVIGRHDHFPALFYHSPSPLFSWSAANPRAPPFTS
ncbi:hypothetical protein AAKU61_000220 [Undibacterium sp. GrIS 1.2]|uniref:DUF2946 domain-containing protein n=1 Tax=Undibacterium sp. GrIS 1.2 TaxID=3143933 RepID=UPI003398E1DC